ncbi:QueC-like queuosine biosynthesis [Mycobacterium phage DS6A]|uniref:7-cyano-7-deazaguanine synthase n=1 Tax=Mycobacterium phage DS6A TaxID=45764 RepID=G8I4B2_9CAUD|nr:QueC-like queuosine biosynthesis [Mycobacterium phage DS6A]AER47556.1 hypothetical protein DS6A_2 [Mycobacterium phage DS6A]
MGSSTVAADTLLMLSGGIDSVFCLWRRVQAGLPTRTHHVVLRDREGRHRVEAEAVRDVLGWLRDRGGADLIEHTESRVHFGDVRWIPQNYHLWAYWAGVLLAAPANRGITRVVIPRHADAFAGQAPDGPRGQRSDAAYLGHIELIAGRRPVLEYPIIGMTKADEIAAMPAELLRLCWWCRRPDPGGRPCRRCYTCRQVDAARRPARLR